MRMDQNAPNFSAQQFTYTRAFLSNVKAVTKVDDYTVAIENNFVESLFPYTLTYVLMISPCRAKEVNYDWAQYALNPSGTDPYKFGSQPFFIHGAVTATSMFAVAAPGSGSWLR